MGKGMKIPMTYHIEECVKDGNTIKLEAKDADGNVSKEELPIFNNNSPQERCLFLLEEILTIAGCYKWFTTTNWNQNPKAQLAFQHFGRALKGMHQCKWSKLVTNQRNFSRADFRDKAQKFINKVFGKDVFDDQKDYLLTTKMPKDMGAANWIDRIGAINDRLELLDKEDENMSKRKLCRSVILKNIPRKREKISRF